MNREDWKRIKGLRGLVHDLVQNGVDFVEKHHRHAAKKPFEALESFATVAAPARLVRNVHDAVLSLTYGSIRAVNHAVECMDSWVVDKVSTPDEKKGLPPEERGRPTRKT